MMKIAMISQYLPSGSKIGVGYQAHEMAQRLTLRGHAVTMFSRYGPVPEARYTTVQLPVTSPMSTFRFASLAAKTDYRGFDLIHAHTDDFLFPRHSQPPRVRTLHGSCFMEARYITGFRYKARMTAIALTEWYAAATADRAVCNSSHTRRCFPGVNTIIPCGVDIAHYRTTAPRRDPPTVLFVGTYRWRKRGKLLMEAFARDVLPNIPQARLWMVCEDAPEEKNVTVYGRVSSDKLVELYQQAWVFCLPSVYEGFGVPYIEAMAAGSPVRATPNPGAMAALDGGTYGVICKPEKLGESLLKLLSNGSLRTGLSAAGMERAKRYDWGVVLDQYETIYRETLS